MRVKAPREITVDRLTEFGRAEIRGVVRPSVFEAGHGRAGDVPGRVEVGLAHAKGHDVLRLRNDVEELPDSALRQFRDMRRNSTAVHLHLSPSPNQLLRELFELRLALGVQRALDRDDRIAERDVLRLLEHALHHLRRHRRPGAVLDEADRTPLVVALGEMVDEVTHPREDVVVVRRRRKDELAVAERVLDGLGLVVARKVAHRDLLAPLRLQELRELQCRGLGVSVDRRVGDADAGRLDRVGRPCVVLLHDMRDHLGRVVDRTVQRQDLLDLKPGRLLEERLHLRTELADDADVVAPRLAVPALGVLAVKRTELAEAVRGEEDLVRRIVGDDHLGPVDHRRRDERKYMLAGLEGVAFLHDESTARVVVAEIVLHHHERLRARHDRRRRIRRGELRDVRGVVRLHVLDDQIVDRRLADLVLDVLQPLVPETLVDRVEDDGLLVLHEIGVVGHPERHHVLPLEQVDLVVIHANVLDVFCNLHIWVLYQNYRFVLNDDKKLSPSHQPLTEKRIRELPHLNGLTGTSLSHQRRKLYQIA